MRITSTESPILQALLPAEKIKSRVLEVEMEASRERVHKAAKSTSNSTSPKWLDRGSRDTRNRCRLEEDTWRQSRSVSKHSTSPNCTRKSLQSRDRAVPLQNAHHTGAEMLKTTRKPCHTLSDEDRPKETGNTGHAYWKQAKRGELDCTNNCTNRSDQGRRGYARHGYHKMSQDSNVADRSGIITGKYSREVLQHRGPPAGHARQGCSRSYKLERKACDHEGLRNQADNEERFPGSESFKAEVKARSDKHGHGEVKGHNPPISAKSYEKSSNFEKEDGKPFVGMETGSLYSKEKSKQIGSEAIFESAGRTDVGALQRVAIPQGSDTTSLQVEGVSSIFAEAPSKNVQSSSSNCEGIMELSRDADNHAKRDAACLDTKKEYDLLASLLLDDSLDIDQDFDVTLAASGSALPDSMYCESIFGDYLELPAVSMDIESVVEVRTAISVEANINMSAVKPSELSPHLPAICGLLEGGRNTTMPKASSSNLIINHPRSEDNGSRLAEDLKASSNIAEARPFSRVFVDVTNTFEILDNPAVKGRTEEDDAHRINQRQRQVEFGKNTLGYERYSELVSRCKRKLRDPQTPNPKQVCSKRSWDGQIRKWRRLLHVYDPPREHGEEEAEDFSTHRPSLQKDADPKRANTSQGFSESKDILRKDASLTIYNDWDEL